MMHNYGLTIQDVLQRKSFSQAEVAAGASGLSRPVTWTHILETDKFDTLINGGELILTTGAGLQLDAPDGLKTIKALSEKNAVCLCVEIGTQIQSISPDILRWADEQAFPIIIFRKIVKFVDITQDLHAMLINRQHEMLRELNGLSVKFNELSLLPNGILKILQLLNQSLKKDALFISEDSKPYYYPPEAKEMHERLQAHFGQLHQAGKAPVPDSSERTSFIIGSEPGSGPFVVLPVKSLGQVAGYLCLQTEDCSPNDFFYSIMDRAALAIAQIVLRNRTLEERKQNLEDKLVRNLLQGKACEADDLQTVLPPPSQNLYYRVFLIRTPPAGKELEEEDWEELKLQRLMTVRSLFKRHGFFPVLSVRKNELTVIPFFIAKDELVTETGRFTEMADTLRDLKENTLFDGGRCQFGISKPYQSFMSLPAAHQEAKDVLALQEQKLSDALFYEDIGVYRLLIPLQKSGQLETYVRDHLGPVLEYDEATKSELLPTLEVYLDCCGSKKEAADRLFVVRQTLYHRLEKLEQLLGDDFMDPANRLAIELALKARRLLDPQHKTALLKLG